MTRGGGSGWTESHLDGQGRSWCLLLFVEEKKFVFIEVDLCPEVHCHFNVFIRG